MIRFDDKLAAFAIAKAAKVRLNPFSICISQHDADGALEGGDVTLTAASWSYKLTARRAW